jgi:chromosome segregation ATPase
MPSQTRPEDALLAEFQELIHQIGKEVSEESLSPALKDLVTMWQAGVDEHQTHMAQLVIDLENRTEHIGEILSRTQQVSEEIDSSSVSLGEKWKSSAEVLATGLNEILEKTDVPSVLKSLTDELHEYQKIHSNLDEAHLRLKESHGLFENEVESYRSLVSESVPRIMEMLESNVRHLEESDRIAAKHISALKTETRKLSDSIEGMAKKVHSSMMQSSALQDEMDCLSRDTSERVNELLKYSSKAPSEIRELTQQIIDSVDKALQDAFLKYSSIERRQEEFGERLSSVLLAVKSLITAQKSLQESSLTSVERAREALDDSTAYKFRRLAEGQEAITDRIKVLTCGLLAATVVLIYLIMR